jgi:hypothetical protein
MVYAVNTLGAILGVVVAVHLLMDWLGLKATVIVGAAIDVGLGIVLLAATTTRTCAGRALLWPAGAALAALLALAFTFDIDPRKSASGVFRSGSARISPDDKVIYHRDGKTATVDVVEYRGARAIRTNGKVDAAISTGTAAVSGDEYTMALLALLPLGHRPDAQSAAVIGFGSGHVHGDTAGLAAPEARRHHRDRARHGGGCAPLPAHGGGCLCGPAQPHRDRRCQVVLRARARALRHHRFGALQPVGERRGLALHAGSSTSGCTHT